jgi:hypothetical protein
MPVVHHSDIAAEPFKGGASYQTLVGDEQGSTPIRVGIQTSPPGYKSALTRIPTSRRSRSWRARARLGCKGATSSSR